MTKLYDFEENGWTFCHYCKDYVNYKVEDVTVSLEDASTSFKTYHAKIAVCPYCDKLLFFLPEK